MTVDLVSLLRNISFELVSNIWADFPDVMRSFLVLLKQGSHLIWQASVNTITFSADSSESLYPSIVFDAIKDNPAYLRLIESQADGQNQLTNIWALTWLAPFARSVATLPQNEGAHSAFADVLAKLAAFALEELQHSRFMAISPYAVQAMMKVR
jgi:senataxin